MKKSKNVKRMKYESRDGSFAYVEIRLANSGLSRRNCRYVSVRCKTEDKDKREPILVHVCIDCGTVHVSDGRVEKGKAPKKEWRISRDPDIELKPGTVRI